MCLSNSCRPNQDAAEMLLDELAVEQADNLLLDERASLFHWATFFPKELGAATAYLVGQQDKDGKLMIGDGLYRLRVPADVPASDFWSLIVYGKETKAFDYRPTGDCRGSVGI